MAELRRLERVLAIPATDTSFRIRTLCVSKFVVSLSGGSVAGAFGFGLKNS